MPIRIARGKVDPSEFAPPTPREPAVLFASVKERLHEKLGEAIAMYEAGAPFVIMAQASLQGGGHNFRVRILIEERLP